MRRSTALAVSTVVLALALAAGCAASAPRVDARAAVQVQRPGTAVAYTCPVWHLNAYPDPTAADGSPGNTPQAEALARALDAKGRAEFADVYGDLYVDYPPGRVVLCVTDLTRGRAMVQAAERAAPGIDPSRIDLRLCHYSRQGLDQVLDHLGVKDGKIDGFPVYTMTPALNGSGVGVTTSQQGVDSPVLRRLLLQRSGGVPVTVTKGAPAVPAAYL
jgi:hypothetical protein